MTMTACYDLARQPPTYDAVAWLALLELERLRLGEEDVEVRVLPGPRDGFRRDSNWPRSTEERAKMRDEVLVPLIRSLPSVRAVSVDRTRQAAGWGKDEYLVGLPAMMQALRAGCRPLRAGRPISWYHPTITFTLREAEHHPLRNSRAEEWFAAARQLTGRGYHVTVIRDAAKVGEAPPPGVTTYPDASSHLDRRMATYSGAVLNVGVSNGPTWLSIFMGEPTLMLRPTTNAAQGCYDDAFFAQYGLPRGSQPPASPPHQRLLWEEDYCETIVRAVEDLLAESAPRRVVDPAACT